MESSEARAALAGHRSYVHLKPTLTIALRTPEVKLTMALRTPGGYTYYGSAYIQRLHLLRLCVHPEVTLTIALRTSRVTLTMALRTSGGYTYYSSAYIWSRRVGKSSTSVKYSAWK